MNELLQIIEPSHGMNIVLALLFVLFLMVLWNIQRDKNNQVDVKDLVCTDGRLNEAKFMRFTAFAVSTWGFVYLIVDQRFSEWYFTGYMAMWAGNALLNKWLSTKEPPKDPPPPPQP